MCGRFALAHVAGFWSRFVVPATGFYEWKRSKDGKVPCYIHLKDDSFFAFAGLYDRWTNPDTDDLCTFTVITATANTIMEKIHNRMPVILKASDEDLWLSKESLSETEGGRLLVPYSSRTLEAFEVSKEANSPVNESKELILPT